MSREGLHRNIKTLAALAGLDFFLLCILRIIKYRKKEVRRERNLNRGSFRGISPQEGKVTVKTRLLSCMCRQN